MNSLLADKKKVEFVVSNFIDLESKLIDCLGYIPYIEQNYNTISPKFIPIILDACSLIESIFKDIVGKGKFNFKDYSEKIDEHLGLNNTISIVLTSPVQFLEPFKDWKNKIPEWWSIYNKLKHDRLNNFHLITYNAVVASVASLHQLISKNRKFTNHICANGWISTETEMIGELYSARMINENCLPIGLIACESKLFVSPLDRDFISKKDNDFFIDYSCEFSNRVRTMLTFDEIEM